MANFWKKLILFVLIVSWMQTLIAQKRIISADDLGTWQFVLPDIKLNNDGSVLSYYIMGKPAARQFTAVLQSTKSSWSMEFPRGVALHFTSDSKKFLCALPNNELVIQYLNSKKQYKIGNVGKRSICEDRDGEWLAYLKMPQDRRELILLNLSKEKDTISYHQVDDYFLNGNGSCFVIKSKVDSTCYSLKIIDIKKNKIREFYRGNEPTSVVLDDSGKKIAFLTDTITEGGAEKTLWYWNADTEVPEIKKPVILGDKNLGLVGLNGFSKKYEAVFCTFGRLSKSNEIKRTINPIIWRYNSPRLESDLSEVSSDDHTYSAAWYPDENRIVQLQMPGETEIQCNDAEKQLVFCKNGYKGEWNWNESAIPSCTLVEMKTGKRTRLTQPGDRNAASYVLSPKGNQIVYFDADSGSYFNYNVEEKSRKNITSDIATNWTTYNRDDEPFAHYINIGVAGFSADESTVFLYDQYDIYQIDLTGKKAPINLTNGYGKNNNVVFRFAYPPDTWSSKKILLTAFSRKTKENGFFEVVQGNPQSLTLLTMQPALFTGVDESQYVTAGMPVKAKNAPVYILTKMDASHAPDVYLTRNFKTFKKLSDIHPENDYNWLTTELVDFKTLDGKKAQGILYKPENFDPGKKYPLVFYYYEKISECLNLFIPPSVSIGPVNIPYLVSNGYIVFTPDIHFEIGYPGRSSYNTVMGAANSLVKLPYIDSTKMAIQGHSFGGFQTNYIVTHTNRFAAACSAAGFTNFVSAYGAVIGEGYSRQGQYELYRDRIGATLWARPDLYLENSPVFRIDKISTPILMMHNKDDDDVPVEQGLEFFTGLRRLGKTAYLLQYKGEGHIVLGESARDYSKKMLEFFNFYLKNGALPSWMTDTPANIIDFAYPFPNRSASQK